MIDKLPHDSETTLIWKPSLYSYWESHARLVLLIIVLVPLHNSRSFFGAFVEFSEHLEQR